MSCVAKCPGRTRKVLTKVEGTGAAVVRGLKRFRPAKSTELRVLVSQDGRRSRLRDFSFKMRRGIPVAEQLNEACLTPGSLTEVVSCD